MRPQTLFNPNKTVVKMFLVTYNFGDMPVNHMTFLRHRIFLVPVEDGVEGKGEASAGGGAVDRKKILCYLIHLRYNCRFMCLTDFLYYLCYWLYFHLL